MGDSPWLPLVLDVRRCLRNGVGLLAAVFVLQPILNPAAAATITVPSYGPYVNLLELLAWGASEAVLMALATWLAIHSLLRRQAVDLLAGNRTADKQERFYERTRLWGRMSLYSQTIVNNCVNDVRRVVATLVGIIGCTALIVTAITLSDNIARSIKRQYEEIYHFDTLVYLDTSVDRAVDKVGAALRGQGVACVPVYREKMQVRQADGNRTMVSVVVPEDEARFDGLYHLVSDVDDVVDLGTEGA